MTTDARTELPYYRRYRAPAQGDDPRREAREMGYVARAKRNDDAPEEGSE